MPTALRIVRDVVGNFHIEEMKMNKNDYYKINDTGEFFTIGKPRCKPVCTVWYGKDAINNVIKICAALNSVETIRQQPLCGSGAKAPTPKPPAAASHSDKRCMKFVARRKQ
jgi:hypothetical protein